MPYFLTAGTYGRGALRMALSILQASAGTDGEACVGEFMALDAQVSNAVPPVTYLWSVVSGPDLSPTQFSDTMVLQPNFTPTAAGSYVLQLRVEDHNATIEDTVNISVGDVAIFRGQQLESWASAAGEPEFSESCDMIDDQRINMLDLVLARQTTVCQ